MDDELSGGRERFAGVLESLSSSHGRNALRAIGGSGQGEHMEMQVKLSCVHETSGL